MSESDNGGTDCDGGLGFVASASWECVGRKAVAGELYEARQVIDDEFWPLEEALRRGEEIDAAQVRDARMALNRAHRVLEEYVATTTDGTEPWGQPVPDIPFGRLREISHGPTEEADE